MFHKGQPDDSHEFKPLLVEIEERPPNPLGRIVFWIVITALVFACSWMIMGKVDVVITARGKVIPKGEVKVIQPLNIGMVHAILIEQGDYVRKGQVLIEIDPSNVDPELASLRSDLKRAMLDVDRINALLENRPFHPEITGAAPEEFQIQRRLYLSEKNYLSTRIKVKQETMAQLDQQLAAIQKAAEHSAYMAGILSVKFSRLQKVRDIISQDEYTQTESELNRYTMEVESSRHRVLELHAQKEQTVEQIAHLNEEFRNTHLTELAKQNQHASHLRAQIEKAEFVSTRQQLISPVDGYVSKLSVHTPGGVVTPAERLALIIPSNSPLQIKATLENKDAGFVSQGMAVAIKVDTFNFQKYGTLGGKIVEISRDSVEHETLGLVYETLISPLETHLMVDGQLTSISSGMGVTAEIKVGHRRIIEFFIYPLIKHMDEGMSVK